MTTKQDISSIITYKYIFEPDKGPRKEFTIKLDGITLNRVDKPLKNPEWIKLSSKQCSNCPLDAKNHPFCPIASGLVDIIEAFKDTISHHEGIVTVETSERTISKRTSMQDGISSLIGIYMVTSGCPVMEKLKPMVRYHLPFASINETIYRSTSMYLLGQYFIKKNGKQPDWDLEGLKETYNEIAKVNCDMCKRIQDASNQDASMNAIVILDIFAKILPFSIEDTLEKLEYLFVGYLK